LKSCAEVRFKKGLLLVEIVAILILGGMFFRALNRNPGDYRPAPIRAENSLDRLSDSQLNELYHILTDYSVHFVDLFAFDVRHGLEWFLLDWPTRNLFKIIHGV